MRKFALLLAFVLVMACAGGAFAVTITVDNVIDKDITAKNAIRGLGATDTLQIDAGSPATKTLSAANFQWIYEILTSTDSSLAPTTFNPATYTLTLDLSTGGVDYQTEIPDGAFKNYKGLETITVTVNKITKIGANAFENSKGINSAGLLVSAALVSIGNDAFKKCDFKTSSQTVSITSSVLTSIGTGAFAESNVDGVTISAPNCAAIPANAFSECEDLTTVNLSNSGVTAIGEKAFFKCGALTTVTVGSGSKLEKIGKSAFEHCSGGSFALAFTAATKLTTIEEAAFRGCTNLDRLTDFDKTKVTAIGDYAFENTKVGAYAQALKFPDTLNTIGKSAFSFSSYSPSAQLGMVFKSGTSDALLTTAAEVAAFMRDLNIGGAFAKWPVTKVDENTIKIDDSGSSGKTLAGIVGIPMGAGGIIDNPNDPDTKTIVGILKGAGFTSAQIYLMLDLGLGNNTYALSESTIEAIAAINSAPSVVDKAALNSAISSAQTLLDNTKTAGSAAGDRYTTQAEKDKLQAAINTAQAAYDDPTLPANADMTAYRDALQAAVSAFNATVQTYNPGGSTGYGGGSGSTGGSGGCAAGFAPIAALFVLGAMKLRKGR